MCVVCLDAPKDHIIVPCGHQLMRVRGVRGEAEESQQPSVPLLPHTHQLDHQGVPSLKSVARIFTAPTLC